MRVRHDLVFISSLLLTVALLCMAPSSVENARTTVDNMVQTVGFSSLAIIAVGLLVTWTGYIRKVSWTWFVIFIIVWLWAFPGLILPHLQHGTYMSWRQILSDAVNHPGLARDFIEEIATFLLLAIALLLPIGSFFRRANKLSK